MSSLFQRWTRSSDGSGRVSEGVIVRSAWRDDGCARELARLPALSLDGQPRGVTARLRIAAEARHGARRGACAPGARRRRSLPPTRTTSTTWTAACRSRRRRSRAATCGSSGPAATIASGTRIADHSFGALDLLKTLSSHPTLPLLSRDNRWNYLGLVNEPCFEKPTGSRPEPATACGSTCAIRACAAGSVRERQEVPGRRDRRARGKTVPVGSYYGEPTGVVGLRLFPNPDFDEKARQGSGTRSATTRDPDLLRLARTWCGRTASACRAASATSARTRSSRPPIPRTRSGRTSARTSAPSTSGWTASSTGRATTTDATSYQLLHTSRPGTLDTSLVSTDNINNPRTMNAVYLLGPRLGIAKQLGQGDAGRRRARQQAVQRLRSTERTRCAVLRAAEHDLDAARAEGRLRFGRRARRAQPRVPQHRPLQRGVAAALPPAHRRPGRSRRSRSRTRAKNSVYWQATERQTPDMARFFLASDATRTTEGRAGRRAVPDRGRGDARARQDGVRRHAARAATRASCRRCRRASTWRAANGHGLSRRAGTSTGRGPRRTSSRQQMREIVLAPTTSSTTTILSTELRVPSRCSQTNAAARSRPTRIARQHLGQLLVAVLQGPAARSARSQCGIPLTGAAVRLPAAGGRPRLHAAGLARQPVVDGAVPAEQHRRAVQGRARRSTARMQVVRGLDRADALARAAREGPDVRDRDRGPGVGIIDRTTGGKLSACRRATFPPACGRCSASGAAGSVRCSSEGVVFESGRSRRARRSTCWRASTPRRRRMPDDTAQRAQEEAVATC